MTHPNAGGIPLHNLPGGIPLHNHPGGIPLHYPAQRVGSLRFRQVYLTEPLFTQGDQRILNTGHSNITL